MLRRIGSALWGYLAYTVGILLVGWVLLNLFVQVQPEAENRTPAPAALSGSVMILIGIQRVTDTPWHQWRFWRSTTRTGALLMFLVVFALAYCWNLLHRLQQVTPGPFAYTAIVLDLMFLTILGRVVWLVARVFSHRPHE